MSKLSPPLHSVFFLLLSAAMFLVSPFRANAQEEGREMEAIGKTTDPKAILAKNFPPGSTHQSVMMPMADGVKLATEIFTPPGEGPWPVLFTRGYYGRLAGAVYADRGGSKKGGFVFVSQAARGTDTSEGKGTYDVTRPDFEIQDCRDALDWIAKQSWCNGKIYMAGASGNGIGSAIAYLAKSPHLAGAVSDISAAFPYYYWGYENSVRRDFLQWFRVTNGGQAPPEWPKPTIHKFDPTAWERVLNDAAADNKTVLSLNTGWYDLNSEGPLDFFAKFASTGKIFVTVQPKAHGNDPKYTWPQKGRTRLPTLPDLITDTKIPAKSQLVYYLMGNYRDPNSIGNIYKTTDVWPVPNTPTPYYFHADGTLSTVRPAGDDQPKTFAYDPKKPAPSYGGNGSVAPTRTGPADQSPLKERADVLRFISPPLETPLEITGKIRADLFVSTDVPDTLFVVKVVDIHPDGYEMLLRESAGMGRYVEELKDNPAPLEKGRVYQLKIDLGSTAILMDKGHRLGVLVTSSSEGSYEVHPNSFEPVTSYEKSPVANQSIHLSEKYPSSITVPVIGAGAP